MVKPALLIRLVELVLGRLDPLGRTDSKISFLFKNRSRNDKIISLLKGVSLASCLLTLKPGIPSPNLVFSILIFAGRVVRMKLCSSTCFWPSSGTRWRRATRPSSSTGKRPPSTTPKRCGRGPSSIGNLSELLPFLQFKSV